MLETLLEQYRNAAVAHGEGLTAGNSRKANEAHDELRALLREIASTDNDVSLLELYDDENPWVQLSAAAHTLEVYENQAVAKLQSIMENHPNSLVELDAKYTLKEWKESGLKFRD